MFVVPYQTGAIAPLLVAVAEVKVMNEGGVVPKYHVQVAGTYACRAMRTINKPSLHSWPVAIDINPQNNSMGGGRGDIPLWFVQIFEKHGFEWGGAWGDPMHLEQPDWYGPWDGHYPEVDTVALTDAEKQALAFIGAHEKDFIRLFDWGRGIEDGMADKSSAGSNASATEKAGFRDVRKHGLNVQGPTPPPDHKP